MLCAWATARLPALPEGSELSRKGGGELSGCNVIFCRLSADFQSSCYLCLLFYTTQCRCAVAIISDTVDCP